jgi:DNA-binding transcriptional ArsR family regulator
VTENSWPSLRRMHDLAERKELHLLSPAIYDAIADRLEEALSTDTGDSLEEAATALHTALRAVFAAAPAEVKNAMRGTAGSSHDLITAFWAGQTAFAQAFASRALDKRADDRLLSRLTHRQYERYVRALLNRPSSGDELSDLLGERKETVSRKLKVLADLGAIERRREGNHVINSLSPTARSYLRSHNIAAWSAQRTVPLRPDVADALKTRSQDIAEHMRHTPVLGAVA